MSPAIVGKVNSLVNLAEDRRLADALKRIDISGAASHSAAETPKNDLKSLEKKIAKLSKKLGGKNKVSNSLSPLILFASSLAPCNWSLLADVCDSFLEATVDEVLQEEGQATEEADDTTSQYKVRRHCLRQKEGLYWQEARSQASKKDFSVEGSEEEGWQEVGLAC